MGAEKTEISPDLVDRVAKIIAAYNPKYDGPDDTAREIIELIYLASSNLGSPGGNIYRPE